MEKTRSADQKRQRILYFIAVQAEILDRRGSVVQTWRECAGRRLGPYFSLIFRQEGRQRSLYLGSDPQLAGEVREWLEQAQKPLRERRAAEGRRARGESELRRHKAAWDAELRAYGLRLKGWEVRGWRTARARVACLPSAEASEAGLHGLTLSRGNRNC